MNIHEYSTKWLKYSQIANIPLKDWKFIAKTAIYKQTAVFSNKDGHICPNTCISGVYELYRAHFPRKIFEIFFEAFSPRKWVFNY